MSNDLVETNQTGAPLPATDSNSPIQAGRIFAFHFKRVLTAGERAVLRRADIVATQAAFWACLRKAEALWPAVLVPRHIAILEALITSGILDGSASSDDMGNVGTFMRKNAKVIKPRRMEAMLAANTREEAIDEFSRLMEITRGAAIDVGLLFNDLVFFGDGVRRQWAGGCFI